MKHLLHSVLSQVQAGSTKGSFVEWLAASNFTHAWYLEDDVAYTGAWPELFARHAHSAADLLAFVDTSNLDNYWYSKDCSQYVCEPPSGVVHWPMLRMSRRLAQQVASLASPQLIASRKPVQ